MNCHIHICNCRLGIFPTCFYYIGIFLNVNTFLRISPKIFLRGDNMAINVVERIVEICKVKGIPVSKLEKDLGYGNGFLNPKKVSDIKSGRLFEILDYLGVSSEEFFNVGSPKLQATETALTNLKKVNPELYDYLINKLESSEGEKIPATDGDGQIGELELAVSTASDKQRRLIQRILNYSDDQVSAFLSITQSSPDGQ